MSLRSVCAVVAAAGLVAVPACKKPKPADPDSPNATPDPTSGSGAYRPPVPNPNADPNAPRAPVFGGSDPRTAAYKVEAKANFEQIGLAIMNYEAAVGSLPRAIVDKAGKPLLSWRVAILPYLEQANLQSQFKVDEPWDGPTNKPLIAKMPKVFAPPRTETNGYTFARGFSGPGTWLPPATGPRPQATKLSSFVDGASITILVAEAAEAVVWTKPDEMAFDPNKPPPQLGGVFGGEAHALFADGRVKVLKKGTDPTTLSRLIQIADGAPVSVD